MSPKQSAKTLSKEPAEGSLQEIATDPSTSAKAEQNKEAPTVDASSSKSPEASDSKDKEDEGEKQEDTSESTSAPTTDPSQWQAVYAPQYNAYYFYNSVTQETTWTNPLQPQSSTSQTTLASAASTDEPATETNAEASTSTGPPQTAAQARYAALQAAAAQQGIDPLLAHLDPTLLTPADLPTFTARFNARTGKFAPDSSRTPGHLSEYERAKRMSEFYFDVNKWEEQLAERGGSNMAEEGDEGGSGKKRKRPTKKDLERFKEQKKQKKIAKTAWLRT
ncbi:hypothetical protein NLJ89_g9427 [Agrocybe chaxingu]|uniref:WW domain-containing protein n=1 Tax=Agrocybe chaxingu TaxID=84603 RepID=A0A9W8MTJ8_9AGAR|nr:hypothetical protein NLJ89_g9427 [Agrocybe chaxingu]